MAPRLFSLTRMCLLDSQSAKPARGHGLGPDSRATDAAGAQCVGRVPVSDGTREADSEDTLCSPLPIFSHLRQRRLLDWASQAQASLSAAILRDQVSASSFGTGGEAGSRWKLLLGPQPAEQDEVGLGSCLKPRAPAVHGSERS